jgi:predicted FMN-binding regulatory protein PaiB
MYIPDVYKNENQQEIKDFLHNNSFGILINQTNGKLWATHIPLELDTNKNGKQVLQGHISKENPQWEGFMQDDKVLLFFQGLIVTFPPLGMTTKTYQLGIISQCTYTEPSKLFTEKP